MFKSYAESILAPDETCLYIAGASVVRFAPLIAGALVAILSPFIFPIGSIGKWISIAGFLFLVVTMLSWNATELAVTNQRVILKTGLLKRFTSELYLQRCEGVDINQNIMERIMGFGTVVIRGVGTELPAIQYVDRPREFKKAFSDAMNAAIFKQSPIVSDAGPTDREEPRPDRSGKYDVATSVPQGRSRT